MESKKLFKSLGISPIDLGTILKNYRERIGIDHQEN